MAGPWSDTGTSLIVLTFSSGGFTGIFAYSPTPGPGNLVLSQSVRSGTDPFGNAYLAGFVAYQGSVFAQLVAGEFLSGSTADDQPFIISASTGFATITSGRPVNTQIQSMLTLAAGATNPQIYAGQITSSPVTTRMFEVGGSASVRGFLTTQVGGVEETIHSLSGFATGISVGGEAHYRLCASPPNSVQISIRNLVVTGTATDTDGATILSAANGLPPSYRPSTAKRLTCFANLLRQPSAGVFESAAIEVETDGSLQCFGWAAAVTRIDLHAIYPVDM